MLIGYSIILWNKGHYKFFPLLLAVVTWLLYERLSDEPKTVHGSHAAWNSSSSLLILNLALLTFAALLYSSFLVMPAVIVLVTAFVVARVGVRRLNHYLPIIALLLLIVPLPSNMDVRLVNEMQLVASKLASWILDSFGIAHFLEGAVLVTEKKQFFAEEACSGIRSLFSSLAAISVYGVMQRYSFWRLGFNLAQTIVWVIVGNAVRIALVVYLTDNWSESFASGPQHELLGLAIFALIFLIALSTDKLIDGLFDGRSPKRKPESKAQPASTNGSNQNFAAVNLALAVCFVMVFLFSARLTYAKLRNEGRLSFEAGTLASLEQAVLPSAIGPWRLEGFEHKIRTDTSLFAPESYIWDFQNGQGTKVTISLDSPYPSFHDLNYCYRGQGWATNRSHDYVGGQLGRSTISMSKRGQFGLCLYSAFDRTGKPVMPDSQHARSTNVVSNIKLVFGIETESDRAANADHQLPVSQIQLFVESDREFTETERQQLEKFYEAVRGMLLASKWFADR